MELLQLLYLVGLSSYLFINLSSLLMIDVN
ncbi:unnamed protein product [Trichobilharzia regenti]|nr:unnamed protein product [Trichobilharzia regenti]